MFEGFKFLPSHCYYTLKITVMKKVATINRRLYRHSYLQQDELIKSDQEMLATRLIQHSSKPFPLSAMYQFLDLKRCHLEVFSDLQ